MCEALNWFVFGIGSHLRDSSVAVAYTADGSLSVWDCLSRRCVQRVTVLELLSLAGGSEGGISIEGISHIYYIAHRLCFI